MKKCCEEQLEQVRRAIELDLNCVVWITDKKRKLLDHLINRRFRLGGE